MVNASLYKQRKRNTTHSFDDGLDSDDSPHAHFYSTSKLVTNKLKSPSYDVRNLYCDSGVWQCIARIIHSQNCSLAAIAVNSMWIAISTDFMEASVLVYAHPSVQAIVHLFCAVFLLEYFIRFVSFMELMEAVQDGCFVLDGCMLGMMVSEAWVLTTIFLMGAEGIESAGEGGIFVLFRIERVCRMSRMCRMVRLMRAMPKLIFLTRGLVAGSRTVFFTLIILRGIFFVFGIVFTQIARTTDLRFEEFLNVPASIFYLFLHTVVFVNADVAAVQIGQKGIYLMLLLYFVTIFFTCLMVMNMLIGVMREVAKPWP